MGALRKGYKQTDIGVIPEDWEVCTIRDCINLLTDFDANGSFADMAANVNTYNGDGYAWYVRATDLEQGSSLSDVKYVDETSYRFLKKSSLYGGEVLIAKRGDIGKVYLFKKRTEFATLAPNLYLLKLNGNISSTYLYYYFKSDIGCKSLKDINASTSLGALYKEDVKNLGILYPPIKEQTAIAETLSDIDSLIEALDRLIAKKRVIKEGVMQELLTGKKRLAGFSEPWVEKRLEDVFNVSKGVQINRITLAVDNGGFPVMNGGVEPSGYNSKYNTNAGSIIISEGGNSCGYVSYMKEKFWAGGHCYVVSPKMAVDSKYLYFSLKHHESAIMQLRTGSGLPNIQKKRLLEEFWILLAPNIREQQAIARILTDMDDEIEGLEKERAKYVTLKQGAMQKLLTGEIRLINTSAETRTIPVLAHVIGGHIVNTLHDSKGWGRTKFQKSMHLVGYCCRLDFGNEYVRNTAGPDDQKLMNHIDSKFKQYNHVRIDITNDGGGGKHYSYTPTPRIAEVEQAFENYPAETQKAINSLLDKIWKMDLSRAEIVSTLYAVWNNRIIKEQPIEDDLLLTDFYDWSAHKSDFSPELVLRGLNYMRDNGIIPIGWGKYIDKK